MILWLLPKISLHLELFPESQTCMFNCLAISHHHSNPKRPQKDLRFCQAYLLPSSSQKWQLNLSRCSDLKPCSPILISCINILACQFYCEKTCQFYCENTLHPESHHLPSPTWPTLKSSISHRLLPSLAKQPANWVICFCSRLPLRVHSHQQPDTVKE